MSTSLLNPNTHWGKRMENLVCELKLASQVPRKISQEQECIPLDCVQPTSVPFLGAWVGGGGMSALGCLPRSGV